MTITLEIDDFYTKSIANNDTSILEYIKEKTDYLFYHNKNYTKNQYYAIEDIHFLFDNAREV